MRYEDLVWPMLDGEAKMVHYPVFPGIDLYINDIHGKNILSGYKEPEDAIEINFCTAGRYELFCGAGTKILLQDGDFSVNRTNPVTKVGHDNCFPTGKYQGVELMIYPERAEEWVRMHLEAFSISFSEIISNTLKGKWVRFGKASKRCEKILRELYSVTPHSSPMWIQLKVLELMMTLEDGIEETVQSYIPTNRAELARHLRDHIIEMEPGEFSLERIAREHRLSVSQMQRVFKSVYGETMYQYLKRYRLDRAADFLQDTEESVAEIAFMIGYQSSGKFSEAFKTQFGVTPILFRQKKAMAKMEQNDDFGNCI